MGANENTYTIGRAVVAVATHSSLSHRKREKSLTPLLFRRGCDKMFTRQFPLREMHFYGRQRSTHSRRSRHALVGAN